MYLYFYMATIIMIGILLLQLLLLTRERTNARVCAIGGTRAVLAASRRPPRMRLHLRQQGAASARAPQLPAASAALAHACGHHDARPIRSHRLG